MDSELLERVYFVYGRLLKYPKNVFVSKIVDEVVKRVPNDMGIEDILVLEYEDAVCSLKRVFQDTGDLSYLFSDENVVFKILFVIERYFRLSSVYCFFLLVVLLKHEELDSCIVLFQPKWFRLLSFDTNLDILKWLNEQLDKEYCLVYDESLLEYFPFLQKEQVMFYISHCKSGCYYTVKQYLEYNDVCYETARLHLMQLVSMGWYKKQKIGKKFVYSI